MARQQTGTVSQTTVRKGLLSQKLGTHCLGSFRRSFVQASVLCCRPSTPPPLGHLSHKITQNMKCCPKILTEGNRKEMSRKENHTRNQNDHKRHAYENIDYAGVTKQHVMLKGHIPETSSDNDEIVLPHDIKRKMSTNSKKRYEV